MDLNLLRMFLEDTTLPVQFLGFEDDFINFAAPFASLGKLNTVSSKSRKTGKTIVFKDLLKAPKANWSKGDITGSYVSEDHGKKRKKEESANSGCGEQHKRARTDMSCKSCFGQKACDCEIVDLNSEGVTEALKNLKKFLDKDNLSKLFQVIEHSRDKHELETGLAVHLIAKLTGNAFMRREKAQRNCPCGCSEKLEASDEMFIGSQNTWFGELDILAGNPASGSLVAVMICDDSNNDDSESDQEDEDFSDSPNNIEVKTQADRSDLNQAVAQSIVFGFTEYNRHTDKGNVIPSVLIDNKMYYIFMYNPVSDVLVSVSNTYNFGTNLGEKGEFIRSVMILWVTLNHRIFFAKHPKLCHEQKCEFQSRVNDLHRYLTLKNYSQKISKSSMNKDDLFPIGVSYLDISHPKESFSVYHDVQKAILSANDTESDNE